MPNENNSSAPLKTAEVAAHPHLVALRTIAEYPATDSLMNMDAANMRRIAAQAVAAQAQPADALDAERWRALLACGRIRLFGTAGVNGSGIHDPSQLTPYNEPYGNYVHFGAEFWSTFPDQDYYNTKENPAYARATLTEFADASRAAMAAAQEGGNVAKGAAPVATQGEQLDAKDGESAYQRGYRHGYNRRDAEVQGALL